MIARIAKITALCLAFLLAAGASAYLTLTLIIKSEDTVIVPALVGKDVVSALELLSDLQLNTKVNGSEYSPRFPKNHVMYQEPEAGAELKKDRDVRIIISKGAKNILMPNLVRLSQQQARMIIEENDISRGQLSHTYSSKVEKNHVIVHAPPAGTRINRGAKVDLLISLGPRPIKHVVPDLTGLALDQAVLIIEKVGLTVGNIRSQFDKRKSRNSIISQEPLAGYGVNVGSPVHLVINRPSGKAGYDRLHHPLYGSLLQHRINSGFLKKRVRVELESRETTWDIFDAYAKPGDEIWVLVPRDHDATVYIFEDDNLVETRIYEAW
jgi:serine/threonine-protein kinase